MNVNLDAGSEHAQLVVASKSEPEREREWHCSVLEKVFILASREFAMVLNVNVYEFN